MQPPPQPLWTRRRSQPPPTCDAPGARICLPYRSKWWNLDNLILVVRDNLRREPSLQDCHSQLVRSDVDPLPIYVSFLTIAVILVTYPCLPAISQLLPTSRLYAAQTCENIGTPPSPFVPISREKPTSVGWILVFANGVSVSPRLWEGLRGWRSWRGTKIPWGSCLQAIVEQE